MTEPAKKDDKSPSTRAQAVTNFTVPVTIAWLLAVGGILSWGMPAQGLLDNAGQVVAALGAGIAFVTVILSVVQDVIPLSVKQRLLYPFGRTIFRPQGWKYSLPSYWAFSKKLMEKAKLQDFDGVEALRADPVAQDKRWAANYHAYRDRPGLVHFSTRHLAWNEMVPVMLLLTMSTVLLGRALGWPGRPTLWAYLFEACLALLALSWLAGRRSSTALVIAVLERMRDEGDRAHVPPQQARRPALSYFSRSTGRYR
jgi:hypothetical protein